MNIEQLRELCLSFPGVTEDIKWENNLCFLIGNKIFLMAGLDVHPTPASFKVPTEQFDEIAANDGLSQASYLAKRQWIRSEDISIWNKDQWECYAKQSYELIKNKLTKKLQKEIEMLSETGD